MTIRKRPRAGVVGLAALAITAAAFTVPAQAARETAPAAAGHQATQRAIDAAVAAGVPGITAEARDAGGVWKSASGVGDLKTGAPRGKNDRFRVGSITDTFVATVLLQMEAEKKLGLDDTVERYLPGVVTGNGNDGRKITVRQLLHHTSGLFDYFADQGYDDTYVLGDGFLRHRYDTLTPEQRVKAALTHAPLFEPGARYSFSHTNDVLAALIVEKIGGRSYEDEVRDRIIEPLGLKATSNPGNSIRLPRPSSHGYSKLFGAQPDRIDDVTEMNGSQGWGDGDIISSAADLNRFYGALMRGKLLPPRQLKEMKTTVDDPGLPGSSYGLGIERLTLSCGTTLWYHDGGTFGWISLAAFTEDGRHQLTFNYNSTWGAETILPVLNAEYCDPPSRSR
ncbi:alkaline D-peptidase [Streptomyces cellostaticus]|uniref:Alkaline D-peptidase n=1 Tax=Streptomyces cellostaticus TaxID=67285 RepID=A0A101NIA1_9ACTN|nr:serine hydrolase domain-containing protein [Streptomyces cellostaticus]KUM93567.1 alkaline D-peptidase [Streptomyces cellostaticus]GHI04330.1 D-alanyl-D-alanine carboxypeptidase [Streptomyces cellostaticus]